MRTMNGLWGKLRNWWEWITRWFPIDNVVTQIRRQQQKTSTHLLQCLLLPSFPLLLSTVILCASKHLPFPIFTFTLPYFSSEFFFSKRCHLLVLVFKWISSFILVLQIRFVARNNCNWFSIVRNAFYNCEREIEIGLGLRFLAANHDRP